MCRNDAIMIVIVVFLLLMNMDFPMFRVIMIAAIIYYFATLKVEDNKKLTGYSM